MDTSLLSCLRLAGVRLRPALKAEKKKRPLRFHLLNPIRLFADLSIMPLYLSKKARVYIHGGASDASKNGIAMRELTSAGVPRDLIIIENPQTLSLFAKTIRILFRLTIALIILKKISKRSKKLDFVDYRIILAREMCRIAFRFRPLLSPLIISDVSPTLNILWSASSSEGNRAVWWQDDFHHFKPLPYDIRGAALLNLPGLNCVKKRSNVATAAVRVNKKPMRVQRITQRPIVGIAVNNWFTASTDQINQLISIQEKLKTNSLHLRLHPNTTLKKSDLERPGLKLCDQNESMANFAARIDICIVGNSASQIWLLKNGVPVVHMPGLDTLGFDRYRYVSSGLVFGCEDTQHLMIDWINDFYEKKSNFQNLVDYTSLDGNSGDISLYDLFLRQPVSKN